MTGTTAPTRSPVGAILRSKWQMLFSGRTDQMALLGVLGLGLACVVFALGRGFFRMLAEVRPDLLVPALASLLTLLALCVTVLALGTAFTRLYASSDLPLLLSWPLSTRQVFTVKTVEVAAAEAPLILILGLPCMAAYGHALGAPGWFYLALAPAAAVFHLLPTGAALLLNVAAMRLVPAYRAREVGVALGILAGALAYAASHLLSAIGGTAVFTRLAESWLGASYLPTAWLAAGLHAAVADSPELFALGLATYGTTGAFALAAGLAVVPRLFTAGWGGAPRRRLAGGRVRRFGAGSPALGMVRKEILVVLRDPTEWAQVAYGLVVIFVVFISGRLRGGGPADPFAVSPVLVFVIGLTLVVTMGLTLALGAVGREGAARWFPLSAPLAAEDWLRAKMWGVSAVVAPVCSLLTGLLGGVGLGLPAGQAVLVGLAVLACAPGSLAISVAVGAGAPVFDSPDPRRRVAPSETVAHFFLQAFYIGVATAVFALGLEAAPPVGPVLAAMASYLVYRVSLRSAASARGRWE